MNSENQYVIVFDTETTGLPKSRVINSETLELWPHIVQFSYVIYNVTKMTLEKICDKVINIPDGIMMSDETVNIHKITNDMTHHSTNMVQDILDEFMEDMSNNNVKAIIGHNISFDINMLKIELLRLIHGEQTKNKSKYKKMFYEINYTNKTFCTMHKTIDLCQIHAKRKDGSVYYKYPKLIELYKVLFGEKEELNNLHNSLNDVLVTLRCYYMIIYKDDLLKEDVKIRCLFEERITK